MKVESLRDRVYNYYLRHRSEGKMFTINYFKTELIHRSTVYRVIKRAENDSGHARVAGSERKAKIMTKSNMFVAFFTYHPLDLFFALKR